MNISGILERFGIQNERLIEVINVLFTMLVVSLTMLFELSWMPATKPRMVS